MSMMRIAGTEFSLKNKSFEIYVQGCSRHCPGCHNPDTQPFDGGEEVDIQKFLIQQYHKVNPFIKSGIVKNLYVSGGDLLCLDGDTILDFSIGLSILFSPELNLWLFTGAEEERIPQEIWTYYDVVKCGAFDKNNLNPEGTFPASKNQKLLFNSYYRERLEPLFKNTEFKGEKKWK